MVVTVERRAVFPGCLLVHYTEIPEKCNTFLLEMGLGAVVFQNVVAVLTEPAFVVLGSDAASGVVLGNLIPLHEPLHPDFHRRGDRNQTP